MIWIIDDEPEILTLMDYIFKDVGCDYFKLCKNFKECEAKAGDIVIHDIIGVGNAKKEKGVLYFTHSGSLNPLDVVDFRKPYDIYKLAEIMTNLHQGELIHEVD